MGTAIEIPHVAAGEARDLGVTKIEGDSAGELPCVEDVKIIVEMRLVRFSGSGVVATPLIFWLQGSCRVDPANRAGSSPKSKFERAHQKLVPNGMIRTLSEGELLVGKLGGS
jgi:hypothetical protein